MIVKFYLPFVIIILLLYMIKRNKILFNEVFWLLFWWGLVVGSTVFSGIYYGYPIKNSVYIYIGISIFCFLSGRLFGMKVSLKPIIISDCEIKKLNVFTWAGVIGSLLFIFDYLRLNGIGSEKSTYEISIIGSVGMLLIPILLVVGLYRFGYRRAYKNKIDVISICLLGGYVLPGILNSGRESMVMLIIGVIAMNAYVNSIRGKDMITTYKELTRKGKTKLLVGIAGFIGIYNIFTMTLSRFTDNEINIFLYRNIVPGYIMEEANKLGNFKFIYYTALSYFGHQVAFLQSILNDYSGPYLFGMYELNIISRRLPDFLELDYKLGSTALNMLAGGRFKGDWQTVLGSLIVDFGKILTPVICAFLGYFVGKSRKYFERDQCITRAVLIAMFCLSMTSTVQMGPFYNTSIYGAYIWWFIIFRLKIGVKNK